MLNNERNILIVSARFRLLISALIRWTQQEMKGRKIVQCDGLLFPSVRCAEDSDQMKVTTNSSIYCSTLPRCRPMPLLHGEWVEKTGHERIPTHSELVDLFGTVVYAHVLGTGELHDVPGSDLLVLGLALLEDVPPHEVDQLP